MSSESPPERISVSRDALRAELAEMELRLRVYFDEQLRHKASTADLLALTNRQAALDRGELTVSQRQTLAEVVRQEMDDRSTATWSKRERFMAVVSACVVVSSLFLSALVAANGGKL